MRIIFLSGMVCNQIYFLVYIELPNFFFFVLNYIFGDILANFYFVPMRGY